jgi:hypothetical protein
MLLGAASIQAPSGVMHVEPPSDAWVNNIPEDLNVHICASQEPATARRHAGDHSRIQSFLVTFQDVIAGRDPRLVINMDKTQLMARKRLRVLTEAGRLPLVTVVAKLPHITGECTVSAGGTVSRPMIILKGLKSLKSLVQLTHPASFASSSSGWIGGDLFALFAIDFCAQLSLYRLVLPPEIADESVLLILDGHPCQITTNLSDRRASRIFLTCCRFSDYSLSLASLPPGAISP